MSALFEQSKEQIAKLCSYFQTNRERFLAQGVKEAHVRQSLIDPFFEALGWDVSNRKMTAPQYREVVPEDSLDVEGRHKAPDYTFRVGTLPKFFTEAKKCGINVGRDPAPAYQLRRYGWSAKVALSVLTDFEEFAVYDCTKRPRESDKASRARILYFRYEEYPDRWRELWDLFSREAVWSGAFDQFAASKRKRGTSEVDVEFLKDIEGWRKTLAQNIARRNVRLSAEDLNVAVQLTIDRVVFLRMAEDRKLEPYGQLLKLCEQPGVYSRFMRELCSRADRKYNSGLFHFQKEAGVSEEPDRITPKLTVDDRTLKPILKGLYFEHGSPYDFRVMPVEILGTVYERFLGSVIRLTPGHRAKVEQKPEVRKAGGVYYTPSYIVEYIVNHTVGKQIEGRSPAQLAGRKRKAPFRVLDMACGSGSFLLGAYRCFLEHCLDWYAGDKPAKYPKALYRDPQDGQWRLTIEEKKRILTTHIFGVDIDPLAVEVSKLSLLLKVLEGETDQSLTLSLLPFGDRALPNLADNIKCGNSLIGPDYFTGTLLPDPNEIHRVNPFDWNQAFPDAMRADGFDCIIGNPPWVSLTGRFRNEICTDEQIHYLLTAYQGNTYMPNMYEYFVSKGTTLVREGGRFGYIVPDRLGFNQQFITLRKRILHTYEIEYLVYNFPFPGITADTLAFILHRGPFRHSHKIVVSEFGSNPIKIPQKDFMDSKEHEWLFFADPSQMVLANQIASMSTVIPLSNVCRTTSGFGGKSELITEERKDHRQIPTIKGDSIVRYFFRKQYWFEFNPKNITGRTTDKRKLGARPKILLRKTGGALIATFDDSGIFPEQSLYFLFDFKNGLSPLYVLGILNSKLMNWYYRTACLTNKASIAQVKKVHLDKLPIRAIGWGHPAHDRMVKSVDLMLHLHKQFSAAQSTARRTVLQRQSDSTDAEIDRLVYQLYDLTPEEIALVESQSRPRV